MIVDSSASVIGAAEMLPCVSEIPPEIAILIQLAPPLICVRAALLSSAGPSASSDPWPPVGTISSPDLE
jgi:hypothetical protein